MAYLFFTHILITESGTHMVLNKYFLTEEQYHYDTK